MVVLPTVPVPARMAPVFTVVCIDVARFPVTFREPALTVVLPV